MAKKKARVKAARKPVKKGEKSKRVGKNVKPVKAAKSAERAKLVGKGVPMGKAREITGEDEDLTQEIIADRRIAWQKGLSKKAN